MFRVKDSDAGPGFSLPGRVVRGTLIVALLASFTSAWLIVQEWGQLGSWVEAADPPGTATIEQLQHRVGFQLACTLLVSATLLLCLLALWWLQRRYLSSEQSLRRVKLHAHDILASTDQGVITTDQQGSITSINSAALRLLRVDFECVGRPLACIITPEVPLVELCREVAERRAPISDRDFTLERAAGRVARVRADAHLLTDTLGRTLGFVIHLRDVTERTLIEERMRRMERFISLGTLASGLHHEIKNPLTALSIHVQLLEERLAESPASDPVDQLVSVLKSEMIRLNGVLDNFRDFAHLQRLTVQPTDARVILEDVTRLVDPQAAQQGVRITLLPADVPLPVVPLDSEKFGQAVLNLVINALEAMPDGGGLTLSAAVREGWLRVEVADTGPGIPPEVQPNLFQPYFSTKDKGTGMGLALSEKLIGQHGGRIEYQTGHRGTTFVINIPLEQASQPQ